MGEPKPKMSFLCKLDKKVKISIIGVILLLYVVVMLIIYYEILGNELLLDGIGYSVIIAGILGIIILILQEIIYYKCDPYPKSGYEP